jgi:hypothetical protein
VPFLQQVFLAAFSSQITSENVTGGRNKKAVPPITDTELVADAANSVAAAAAAAAASAPDPKTKRVKAPLDVAAIGGQKRTLPSNELLASSPAAKR